MVSTYTANGGIEKIGSGEQSGTWGTTTNTNFDIIDRLTNGVGAITLSGTTHTLTTSEGTLSDGMFKVLVLGGSPSGTNTITISPNTADKLYFVQNGTSQTATFTQGSGANVSVAAGKAAIIFADGAGSGAAVTDLSALLVVSSAIDGVNVGATTPGTGAFSSLTVDNVVVNGSNIGHTDDTDLVTVANGVVTVAGEVSATTLDIGGTNITSTAAELNILDGVTATASELNIMDGVTATTAELNIMDGVTATTAELNIMDGVTATTAELNHTDGVTSNIQTQLDSKATSSGVTSVSGTDPIVSSGGTTPAISLKNDFIQNSSSAISTGTTTSFTASTYPTFISGATTSTGGGTFTVTIGGSGNTLNMRDGDGGTHDTFATLLPAGATISGNQFQYLAVQLRPG